MVIIMKDNIIQGCLYSCIFNGFGGHHWILSAKLANAIGQVLVFGIRMC